MKLSEIKDSIMSLAEQDLSISDTDMIRWIDQAIDRINTAVEARFPKVSDKTDDYEPEFDDRYHEILIIFANAKYRESDGDFNSAGYFVSTFNDMLMDMQRDMVILPSFRADKDVQQIVVTDAAQMSYKLAMPSGSYYDRIVVYKNNEELVFSDYAIKTIERKIMFKIPLVVGDKITVVFENKSDLNQPPYSWWSF